MMGGNGSAVLFAAKLCFADGCPRNVTTLCLRGGVAASEGWGVLGKAQLFRK